MNQQAHLGVQPTLHSGKILLIDLNNEASYPTLAIGCLSAPLKNAGYDVDLFSPLAHGMKPLARDQQETFLNYAVSRLMFTANPLVDWTNELLYSIYNRVRFRATKNLKLAFKKVLDEKVYDAIMVSCYLQYYPMLVAIAAEAKSRNIPLLLGGPYFNQPKVAEEWLKIDGISVIFGGEADYVIPDLAKALIAGKGLHDIQGIFRKEITLIGQAAAPVSLTDDLPVPDFDHFAWDNYPHRVIPVMAGRGCSWGHCLFCSDVTTASTRTFRTRTLHSMCNEIKIQSDKYQTKNFIFFDSKLNSDLNMWFGLIQDFQKVVPGAAWVASVHVDGKGENGLDRDSLDLAFQSGLRRISFGLETGSDKLNKRMLKGTTVARNSQFVKDAHSAGISVRTTIILGYPGESAEDVQLTADFLKEHYAYIDRVKLSKFKAIPGTAFQERLDKKPEKYPSVVKPYWDYRFARAVYKYKPAQNKEYRRAKANLLSIVYEINQKAIMDSAQQFNGLM